MQDHIAILDLAVRNELPDTIHRKSSVSYQAALELLDAGYLSGTPANSADGPIVWSPAITLGGRLFLEEQSRLTRSRKWRTRATILLRKVPRLVWGIAGPLIIAWLVYYFGPQGISAFKRRTPWENSSGLESGLVTS